MQPTPADTNTTPAALRPPAAGTRRVVLGVLALLVIPTSVWLLGGFDYLRDVTRLRADIAALGPLAPFVWICGQSLLEGAGVPSTVMVIAATVMWPSQEAALICVVGSTGGTLVGFWAARTVARDWVVRKLPAWALRTEDQVSRHPFVAAFLMRLFLFVAPGPAWLLGLSRARFLPALAGSALGCVPGLYLTVYYGPELVRWARSVSESTWYAAAALGIATAIGYWQWRRRTHKERLAERFAERDTTIQPGSPTTAPTQTP